MLPCAMEVLSRFRIEMFFESIIIDYQCRVILFIEGICFVKCFCSMHEKDIYNGRIFLVKDILLSGMGQERSDAGVLSRIARHMSDTAASRIGQPRSNRY